MLKGTIDLLPPCCISGTGGHSLRTPKGKDVMYILQNNKLVVHLYFEKTP